MTIENGQVALFPVEKEKPKTDNVKRRWEYNFQKWSDTKAQDGLTHYGACGYGAICNFCNGDPRGRACVRALNEMLRTKRKSIDYNSTTFEQAFDGNLD